MSTRQSKRQAKVEEERLHAIAIRTEQRSLGLAERLRAVVQNITRPGGLEDDLEPLPDREDDDS